jgi:uncharacterized delta-60 repeat protein
MFEILKTTRTGRQMLRTATKTLGSASVVAALIGFAGGLGVAQTAGTLDTTFGIGGTVTTIFTGAGSPVMLPIGAAQLASGDIVVLSEFDFVSDEGTQIGLTRYTPAGKLGTTFGTKGSTITNFSSFTFDPFAFALEPNGKILVAGFVSGGNNFGLAQFTANGVLDTTFGTDGVASAVTGADFPSARWILPLLTPHFPSAPSHRTSRKPWLCNRTDRSWSAAFNTGPVGRFRVALHGSTPTAS